MKRGRAIQSDWEVSLRRPGAMLKFPVPAFVPTAAYATEQKGVDTTTRLSVSLAQPLPITATNVKLSRRMTMTLTLKGLSKNGKAAFYGGAAVTLRLSLAAFPNKTPPTTIEVADGVFSAAKAPKVKMTIEERKAARAAAPKLTLAEKIARREAALAKDKEKLAKESAPSL